MKTLTTLVFVLALLALAPLAHAQTGSSLGGSNNTQNTTGSSLGGSDNTIPSSNPNNSGSSITLLNPLNAGTSLPALLDELLQFIIRIGTVVIILMVVYIGFKFVMAQGEPGKISEAREALMWTVVGALILLGAQAIASAIQATAQAL